MRSPSSARPEIPRLFAEELDLWNRLKDREEARDRAVSLATALTAWQADPGPRNRAAAEKCLRSYQESPAVRKFGAVALGLSLAACNSVSREIRALNDEERALSQQITVLQEARKANVALVTALQESQRSGSSKNRVAVSKAREHYETAISRVP